MNNTRSVHHLQQQHRLVTPTGRTARRTTLLNCSRWLLSLIYCWCQCWAIVDVPFVAGQYPPSPGAAYGVESGPFTTTGSTISPAEFPAYFQPNGINWQPVTWFVQNGCDQPPQPSISQNMPLNQFCLSPEIPLQFQFYGVWMEWLQVDIAGGTILFQPSNNAISFTYYGPISLVTFPLPDIDMIYFYPNYDRGAFFFGYNTEKLWNLTSSQLSYATIVSNQTNSSSILLMHGTVQSYFNASIPAGTNTVMEFELQFHSATGEIVMHIIQLLRATANDLWHPLSIGTTNAGTMNSDQASMFLNNEFLTLPSSQPFSSTVHWIPFNQSLQCDWTYSCHTCLQPLSQCAWCPTSGACLPVPLGDQQPAYLNMSQAQSYCPISPSNTTSNQLLLQRTECPLTSYLSSYDCLTANYQWCTGEADCAIVPTDDSSSWGDVGYGNLQWNSFVGRCVPLGTTCSTVTCNQLYDADTMQCGPLALHSNSGFLITCICDPGYVQVEVPVENEHIFDPTRSCSICDITQDYFEVEPGLCEKCPSISTGAIIGLSIGAIVVTFLLVKLNSHPLIQRLLVPIQNSIVYFQVISLLALIDFHWPLAIRRGLTWLGLLGLNVFHLTTVQCFMTSDQKLLFTLLTPVAIGSLLLISHILINLYKRIQRCLVSSIELSEMHRMIHKRRELFRRAFISFLLLFYNFLVYTCLNGYFSFDLWEAFVKHVSLQQRRFFLVLFGTIFYVAGIPILFWFLIFPRSEVKYPACCPNRCRKQIAQTIAVQPLVSRYRPGYSQYWEIVFVCLWKILFNAIIVFVSGRDTQIILIATLLISMILSYSYFRPYLSGINNREQQWLMSGSLIILVGGVLFYVGSPGDTKGKLILIVISYLIVIVTMLLMIGIMVYVMLTIIKEYRAAKAVSLLVDESADATDDYDEDEITAAGANNDADHLFIHPPPARAEMEAGAYHLMPSSSSSSLFDRPSSMHELQRHVTIPLPPSLPPDAELTDLSTESPQLPTGNMPTTT